MKIFVAVAALGLLVLIGRLVQLQISRVDEYRDQAEQLVRGMIYPPPVRGRILDRNGVFLAVNQPTYSLDLDYGMLVESAAWRKQIKRRLVREGLAEDMDHAEEVLDHRIDVTWSLVRQLGEQRGVDVGERVERIISRVQRIRQSVDESIREIAEERRAHPVIDDMLAPVDIEGTVGAVISPRTKRIYPQGDTACHIIGLMGRVTAEHLDIHNLREGEANLIERKRHNYAGDDSIGVSGVERMCEGLLRGRRGYQKIMRMASGPVVVEEELPTPGADVKLTIDANLQRDLVSLFSRMSGGHNGSIVVLHVPTNEILALVSVPTYDLNAFRDDYAYLAENQVDLPLHHRAVAMRYPPGSTAKPLAAAAALTDGVIGLETTYHCRGYLHSPGSFRCWIWRYQTGHGDLDVVGAMKNSCNVFLYNVGEQMGVARLRWWYEQFGFCDAPGTGLPEEVAGTIATEGRDTMGRLLAIGQGPIGTTPLHVASAMATIARRGEFLSPVIAPGVVPGRRHTVPIGMGTFETIIEGMYQVVNAHGGTAYKPFHGGGDFDPFQPLTITSVCGKTGTAQAAPQRVDSNENGRIDGEDLIVRRGDMAWFGGFAPRDNPKIAFAVVVEYITEGGGSSVAAPIARETLRLCQQYGYMEDRP
jgi:penicillin-binding protein 2